MKAISCYYAWECLVCYNREEAHFIKWYLTVMTGNRHIVEKSFDEELVPEYWVTLAK